MSGPTAGIGLAIVKGLVAEGAEVIVNGRTKGRVDEAVGRIQREVADAKVCGVAADLGTAEGVVWMVAALPEVDVLVNNVGIFEPKAFEEIPDADWMRFWEVNVMSGVRLGRHYLPGMKWRNWGRVVYMCSARASVTNGAALRVAGGVVRSIV